MSKEEDDMYRESAHNREGLTFAEWFRAATFARSIPLRMDVARKAWKSGEDPTEYAAV